MSFQRSSSSSSSLLRAQCVAPSLIYGFSVPERSLAALLGAVRNGTASLSFGSGGQHALQLDAHSAPLVVTEHVASSGHSDCYVMGVPSSAFDWQGPIAASLSLKPPIDHADVAHFRQVTVTKQAELKRHQTAVFDLSKPPLATATTLKRQRVSVVPARIPARPGPATATTTTTTTTTTTVTPDLERQLLHELALEPLQRRYVDQQFPSLRTQLAGMADLKNNQWHLKVELFDQVDPNHALYDSDAKRSNVRQRMLQAQMARGLTAPKSDPRRAEYDRLHAEHVALHRELERRKREFAELGDNIDIQAIKFKDNVDVAAAVAELEAKERAFNELLAKYDKVHLSLTALEKRLLLRQKKD
jgi:hypothetical protein